MKGVWFLVGLLMIAQEVTGGGFPTGPGGARCMMTMHGIDCPSGSLAEAKRVEGENIIKEATGRPANRMNRMNK